MSVLAQCKALILTSCWILSLSQFHFVSGEKPQCKGDPLAVGNFSGDDDVGFVRDVCVDIIARNFYNKFNYPVSFFCEELANMRTSTCFCKICFKWKRSSSWNKKVTVEVLIKAKSLMMELLKIVAKDESLDKTAGEFVFTCIKDAKRKMVGSGAITEDSYMIDILEDLKRFLCNHCAISDSADLKDAISQFLSNVKDQNKLKIIDHRIADDVIKKATMTGIVRLRFEYKEDGDTKAGAVIIKIPSLAPFYYTQGKNGKKALEYEREAFIYLDVLPALYQMGKCESFAPSLYAVTPTRALVLEDLSVEGYDNRLKSPFLDLDHSRVILNVLAQYHALGYVYLRTLNTDHSRIQLIKSDQHAVRTVSYGDEFSQLCKIVKPFLSDTLYRKILSKKGEILAKLDSKYETVENRMTVILHGDLHPKNFLFKYDSKGRVYKVKIIDFQLSAEGSPVFDLIDLFVNNMNAEVFEANENDLLEHYLATLKLNLSQLQTNGMYNRLELNRDMTFFKYYYFREFANFLVNYATQETFKKEPWESNLAKWIIYLEKKGFI